MGGKRKSEEVAYGIDADRWPRGMPLSTPKGPRRIDHYHSKRRRSLSPTPFYQGDNKQQNRTESSSAYQQDNHKQRGRSRTPLSRCAKHQCYGKCKQPEQLPPHRSPRYKSLSPIDVPPHKSRGRYDSSSVEPDSDDGRGHRNRKPLVIYVSSRSASPAHHGSGFMFETRDPSEWYFENGNAPAEHDYEGDIHMRENSTFVEKVFKDASDNAERMFVQMLDTETSLEEMRIEMVADESEQVYSRMLEFETLAEEMRVREQELAALKQKIRFKFG